MIDYIFLELKGILEIIQSNPKQCGAKCDKVLDLEAEDQGSNLTPDT